MNGLNKVMLIGNLARDPEIKRTSTGDPVAHLRIATGESWRNKNSGERQERTEWHNVVAFGQPAKFAEQYVRKGDRVYVEGQLKTRNGQDQGGSDRYTTEIIVNQFGGRLENLSPRKEGRDHEGEANEAREEQRSETIQRPAPASSLADEFDDMIPF